MVATGGQAVPPFPSIDVLQQLIQLYPTLFNNLNIPRPQPQLMMPNNDGVSNQILRVIAMANFPKHFIQQQQQQSETDSPMPNDLEINSAFKGTSTPINSSAILSMMNNQMNAAASMVSSPSATPVSIGDASSKARRRVRSAGTTVKTAEVWRYFDQRPPPEQAATCRKCQKIIKATNSSTTGMIRHLRSCHHPEYDELQMHRHTKLMKTLTKDEFSKQIQTLIGQNEPSSISPNSTSSSANATAGSSTGSVVCNSSIMVKNHSVDSLIDTSDEAAGSHTDESVHSDIFKTTSQYMSAFTESLRLNEENAKTTFSSESGSIKRSSPICTGSGPKRVKLERQFGVESEEIDCSTDAQTQINFTPKSKKSHLDERAINQRIAYMLILDSIPASFVDQPGFRHLFAALVPGHVLPNASVFETKIVPELQAQLPSDYRRHFLENNRFTTNGTWPISPSTTVESGFEDVENISLSDTTSCAAASAQRSAMNISQSFLYSLQVDEQVSIRKEDSDTSSSVESFPIADSSH